MLAIKKGEVGDGQAEAAERLVGDRAFGQIVTDLAIAIFFGRFDLDRHSHVAHFEFPRLKSRLSVRSADDPIPPRRGRNARARRVRSEEHTSELQSLMRISYAVFCLTKKNILPQAKRTTRSQLQDMNSTFTGATQS